MHTRPTVTLPPAHAAHTQHLLARSCHTLMLTHTLAHLLTHVHAHSHTPALSRILHPQDPALRSLGKRPAAWEKAGSTGLPGLRNFCSAGLREMEVPRADTGMGHLRGARASLCTACPGKSLRAQGPQGGGEAGQTRWRQGRGLQRPGGLHSLGQEDSVPLPTELWGQGHCRGQMAAWAAGTGSALGSSEAAGAVASSSISRTLQEGEPRVRKGRPGGPHGGNW